MGLIFKKDITNNRRFSSSSAAEELTSENVKFLKKVGFEIINHGNSRYSARTDFRRGLVGKGIPYPQSLRFIEVKQQR
jgi:hypothetical protein